MKMLGIILVLALVACSFAIPSNITVHGKLMDAVNNTIQGTNTMDFRIYNVSSGGSALYDSGNISVTTTIDGVYSVLLSSVTGLPDQVLWLGITVGSDSEMAPRTELTSDVYGLILSTTKAGTGNCPGGQVVQNVTSSGPLCVSVGAGTVTSVATTAPIRGGTITSTGTISIDVLNSTQAGYVNKVVAPITVTADGNVSIPVATSGQNGYLSSSDWTTFNNKGSGSVTNVATGNGLTGGPITTTGTISLDYTALNNYTANQNNTKNYTASWFIGNLLGALNWTNLTAIPTACTAGKAFTDISGAGVCTSFGTGSVTSIATTGPITGGTITTTGTIGINVLNSTQAGYVNKVSSPILVTADGNVSIQQSNSTQNGYLSSGDWSTFNNKAGTGNCPGGQIVQNTTASGVQCIATGGTGTVTQVDTGNGLQGGPITGTGTIAFNYSYPNNYTANQNNTGNWTGSWLIGTVNFTNVTAFPSSSPTCANGNAAQNISLSSGGVLTSVCTPVGTGNGTISTIQSTDNYITVVNATTTNLSANLTTFDARYGQIKTVQSIDNYTIVANGTTSNFSLNISALDDRFASTNLLFFLYNASTQITNFSDMNTTAPPNTVAAKTLSFSSVTDGQSLINWTTPTAGPLPTFIPDGIGLVDVQANLTGGTQVLRLYAKVYERLANSTENLLYTTSNSDNILQLLTSHNYNMDFVSTFYELNSTATLVVNLYANVTGAGTAPSVNLFIENQTFSHVEFPSSNSLISETDPRWSANSSTVARTGTCSAGTVTQNTTTSGVQCIAVTSGTVTSIATTSPITGGTITSTGTIAINVLNSSQAGYVNKVSSPLAVSSDGNVSINVLNSTQAGYVNKVDSSLSVTSDGNLSVNMANPNNWTANINTTANVTAQYFTFAIQTALPTCNSTFAGLSTFLRAGANNATTGWACVANSTNTYNWTQFFNSS